MEKYEKLEMVGEGSYGKVYKAREKMTGKLVALKKTKLDMVDKGVELPVVPSPAELGSPKSSHLYLVFEYIDTDLKKFIKSQSPKPLDPCLIQKLLFQLCKGVAHCHSNGVLHRDLKPANLLLVVDDKQLLKIADLGIGRAFTVPVKTYTHDVVTLWYRALEILLGTTQYTTAVDIWAVGCIFAEIVTGDVLFCAYSEISQLHEIFSLLGTPTEQQWLGVTSLINCNFFPDWHPKDLASAFPSLSPQGVDLLTKLLKLNPAERISAKAALDHPYFDSLDKSTF